MIKYLILLCTPLLLQTNSQLCMAQSGGELLIQANRATLERRYNDALSLYNQYITINPNDFRGYFNRGTTNYNATKYDDAIADFTKTLSLNPIYREAFYYRGSCFMAQEKHDKAILDYNHVLEKEPNSVPFLKLRAQAYIESGQQNKALEDLDKCIAIDRLSGDLYKRRAELRLDLKDQEGALRDYGAVEKLIPSYKMVHYIKGQIYLELDDVEMACEELQVAYDHKIVVADKLYNHFCTGD